MITYLKPEFTIDDVKGGRIDKFNKVYRHTKLVIPNFFSESDEKSLKLSSLNNYDMIDEKMSDEDQESNNNESQLNGPKKAKLGLTGTPKKIF
jgi:hypothetical protein